MPSSEQGDSIMSSSTKRAMTKSKEAAFYGIDSEEFTDRGMYDDDG